MELKLLGVIIFDIIPVIIKIVIIGMLIWIGYSFIKKKIKSTPESSNLMINTNKYVRVFGIDIRKRTINKVFLVIGGVPLLAYPMVIIANIMSIAALYMSESIIDTILMLLFVFFTSSYLLTYIICFVFYFKKRDENILVSIIPLIHIAVILLIVN